MKHLILIGALIAALGAATLAQAHTEKLQPPISLDSPVFQGD